MLCQNCGENEANIKYTQIINGVKKEMSLCSKCAKELGIEDINFNMPIHFSSFLDDIFEKNDFMPNLLENPKELTCENCKMSYDDFLKEGKFGCSTCYDTFSNKIDVLLKNIQGTNRHVGRSSQNNEENKKQIEEKRPNNKVEELKERLKVEIQEERYEDAAKTRDEIKKLEN